MPEALWVHIKDEAFAHGRTFNAEVVHLLMDPRRRIYGELRQQQREAVQDLYGDGFLERLDASNHHHPADERTDEQIAAEIEWLPGSLGYQPMQG